MSVNPFMEIIGYVVPFLVGVLFFRLAFLHFTKERFPGAMLFGIIAACLFLSSFPWFQGLAKTWIVSNVNSKLRALGDQVNMVQQGTADMHDQLAKHQQQIEAHQRELDMVQGKVLTAQSNIFEAERDITNQYSQIRLVQTNISTTQTELDGQARKLANVEGLVRTLYSGTCDEEFLGCDTNHVVIRDFGPVKTMWFRLTHCPVPNTVSAIAAGGDLISQIPLLPRMGNVKNVVSASFQDPGNIGAARFYFRYIKDVQETNVFKTIAIRGTNTLVLDGIPLKIP